MSDINRPATLDEIAKAMGMHKRAMQRKAANSAWPFEMGKNKQHFYALKDLPKEIRLAVMTKRLDAKFDGGKAEAPEAALPAVMQSEQAVVPVVSKDLALPTSGLPPLSSVQLTVHRAISNLVDFVNGSGVSTAKALDFLNQEYAAGRLSPSLRWSYEHAWEKRRSSNRLNRNTYMKWLANFKKRGHYAPMKKEKDFSIKAWHTLAVALRQRPQGSERTWVHAQLEKQLGADAPSYDALCAWLREKFSQKALLEGRYSGSQLRAHRFYQHRTKDGLAPASLIHADGWNTHFTAPHPVTGEFVTYEVWHFHDVATRYVTIPGIGLTENAAVIAKGLENFVRELGVPARLQTDSTKVVRGSDRFTKALHSLEERLGFTWTHPKEVGNSQANGIAENFNNTYLDKRSRELATYQNRKSMDDLTFKRVKKLTAQMVKAADKGDLALRDKKKREIEAMGKGHVFDSFDQACAWIVQICHEYNDRPHRALKKVFDSETGKKRHQTPREALNEFIADGWAPVALDDQEMIDAFRPHVVVKVTRETVTPWGGMRYRHPDILSHWNGKDVIVAYDIADYRQVWVKDLKGAPICVAEFVEATRYMAVTAQQADEEKRATAALRRLEKKREAIIARTPGEVIEHEPLKRVEFTPTDTLEPLKRVVIEADFNNYEAPEEPKSYLDTINFLYGEKTGES